ncbi:MAG: DNA methyltransferase [Pseudomonadota bacterium]
MTALTLHEGDCLNVMADLPEAHFDAIVTDPPYHLTSIVKRFGGKDAAAAGFGTDGLFARSSKGFMGKDWDGGDIAFRVETWQAALRVLKPGGHLVAFSAARTYHHMAVAIEVAGFEMRDSILDLYSASDAWRDFLDGLPPENLNALARALASADAPLLGWLYGTGFPKSHEVAARMTGDDKAQWQGWGTALKPAWEPIVLARKPLAETSVARQHKATGTGGINVGDTRIGVESRHNGSAYNNNIYGQFQGLETEGRAVEGRWPANVVHDGSAEVLARFPVDGGGTSARFYYSAKANAQDRAGSDHPTVKPQSLMRWLVRLTTARGGLVLDPFGGSGSTGWAAVTEGRRCHLIERDPDYAAHIRNRLADFDPAYLTAEPEAKLTTDAAGQSDLFGGAA